LDFQYFGGAVLDVALDPWLIVLCLAVAGASRSLSSALFMAIIAASTMNYFVDYFFVDMNFPERSPLYRYFARVLVACLLVPTLHLGISRFFTRWRKPGSGPKDRPEDRPRGGPGAGNG